jgi:peptide-methionine (S)-S-oxide reductase
VDITGDSDVKQLLLGALVIIALLGVWYAVRGSHEFTPPATFPILEAAEVDSASKDELGVATFGSGCFWCTEAVFQRVKGVQSVVSGYSGGTVPNPSYEQVSHGNTGHAEVIQVTFDPKVVSYADLLEVFWRSHDPTTRDRQGHDEGPQYRSAIFYHSDRQRELAELYKRKIDAAGVFRAPLVTEIEPFSAFYPAGADHQDYYNRNSKQPYCRAIIGRKLDALKAVFGERLTASGK